MTFFILIGGCTHMNNKVSNPVTDLSHLNYLTDITGSESLKFAEKHRIIADQRLKSDNRYEKTYQEIFNILSAKDKLPSIFIMKSDVFNFWQDDKHIRGILRKMPITSFNSGSSKWTTVLDIDDLASQEKMNWVYKGIHCLEPDYSLCMISLSEGGKDAGVIREFDLNKGEFVSEGFFIPDSKSHVTWYDRNTLLLGDGTSHSPLTSSGYPTQVRLLKRNQKIQDAEILFSVPTNSMSAYVTSSVYNGTRITTVYDQKSFFEADIFIVDFSSNKLKKIPIPSTANLESIYQGQILFSIKEDFEGFPAGSLLSFPLSGIESYSRKFIPVFIPTETTFLERAYQSKNYLYLETLTDVKRQIKRLSYVSKESKWISSEIEIGSGNETLITLDKDNTHIYFGYNDFLTPPSILYLNDEAKGIKTKTILSSPSRFNSSNLKFDQFKAKSKDGTSIPYFIVYPKNLKFNGKNPTLLFAYGGFEISLTPNYLGSTGKAWLEKGGVYVLANIRGGGEYGPKWHRSALRENRHKAFEDFYAVAQDLIDRKVTSPEKLGIKGGSNGGLLTSVAFTQRPDLFRAVISEVPLANMLEYHNWLAGASWMEEYGDPNNSEMRKYLLSYSPLHNLKAGAVYPEVFYLTNTKDDRVHPGHARQMVARMSELGHKVLYNENTEGGHGRATNMKEMANFLALEFVYLYQKLMD